MPENLLSINTGDASDRTPVCPSFSRRSFLPVHNQCRGAIGFKGPAVLILFKSISYMERHTSYRQGDNAFDGFHSLLKLFMPVSVLIRIVRWKDSVLDHRLGIILDERRKSEIPHTAEAGSHFFRRHLHDP